MSRRRSTNKGLLISAGLGLGAAVAVSSLAMPSLDTTPEPVKLSKLETTPKKYSNRVKKVLSTQAYDPAPEDTAEPKPESNKWAWSLPEVDGLMPKSILWLADPFKDTDEADTGLMDTADTGVFEEGYEEEALLTNASELIPSYDDFCGPIVCDDFHCHRYENLCRSPFSQPYDLAISIGFGHYHPYACYDLASL